MLDRELYKGPLHHDGIQNLLSRTNKQKKLPVRGKK
jgi:hypothetical protein